MHPVILHLASLTPHRPLGVIIPTLLRLGRRVTASEGEVSSRPPPHYSPSCLLCLCGLKISESGVSTVVIAAAVSVTTAIVVAATVSAVMPCLLRDTNPNYFPSSCFFVGRFISPIIGELSKKYPHVTTYKIDIDQEEIQGTLGKQPTLHFFQNGKKADELIGADVARMNHIT
nr:thioredoxin O, mitochondrial-like [Arachis hypogaea]